jgi:hypothetical protein
VLLWRILGFRHLLALLLLRSGLGWISGTPRAPAASLGPGVAWRGSVPPKEPPGTVLIRFEDGSAIVRGDGSAEERQALAELIGEQGSGDEETIQNMVRILTDQGLTFVQCTGSNDPARER